MTTLTSLKLPNYFQGIVSGIISKNGEGPYRNDAVEYWVRTSADNCIIVQTADKREYLYKGTWIELEIGGARYGYYNITQYSNYGQDDDWRETIYMNYMPGYTNTWQYNIISIPIPKVITEDLFTDIAESSIFVEIKKPPFRLVTRISNYDNHNQLVLDTGIVQSWHEIPNTIERIILGSPLASAYIKLQSEDFYIAFQVQLYCDGNYQDDYGLSVLRSIPAYYLRIIC